MKLNVTECHIIQGAIKHNVKEYRITGCTIKHYTKEVHFTDFGLEMPADYKFNREEANASVPLALQSF